jgi:cytochrome c-type biogenesis protein CcmH/NrfG
LSKAQLFAIFAAFALVVLLLFAPNKPPIKDESTLPAEKKAEEDLEQKLNLAISYVQEGKDPMKGIMMLREVLEKDSNNLKAHFYLGVFSVQSGQWEKAKQRFLKVLALDSTESEAYFYLAQAEANSGDTTRAVEIFKKYKSLSSDSMRLDEVQSYIDELKK